MPVIRSFGDRHYTQVSCTTKPFHPMDCPKQVTHPDNDYYLNSSSTLKCPEMTGRKKGRGKKTEMEANTEDGARAGTGSGVSSGIVVKVLPFPQPES